MLIVSSLSTANENRLWADDAGLYLGPLGRFTPLPPNALISSIQTHQELCWDHDSLFVSAELLITAKRKHSVAALHLWLELCGNVTGMNLLQCARMHSGPKIWDD